MAKKQPVTIVKELRSLTERWTEEYPYPPETYIYRVKDLVDMLPAFRAAPQTKLENTLRAIEALMKAHLGVDLSKNQIREYHGMSSDSRKLLFAVCRIINTHHGIHVDMDELSPLVPSPPKKKVVASPPMSGMVKPMPEGEMPGPLTSEAIEAMSALMEKKKSVAIAELKKEYDQVVADMEEAKGEVF